MAEPSARDDRTPTTSPADGLAQLRRLLLAPEQTQLEALQRRLDEPGLHAAEVSRVLAEAISLRTQQDTKLASALQSTVEEILRTSVRRRPAVLVEVIFPVIGPAIRKAIAAALAGTLQAFNQALEHSFSPRGLKWRIEALRTGRPFAEVVLLHTLVYRVEQVFLIHRETGLPLQHRVVAGVAAPDSGMVSGMLAAIQDFVRDSFRGDAGDALQAMQVGDLSVWIEQGPHAMLAAVVRGQPRAALRSALQETLERIHLELGDALESFQGDASPFEASGNMLDACLEIQYVSSPRRRPAALLASFGAVALLGLGVWAGLSLREQRRWQAYVERLRTEPGIVVTGAGTRDGKYWVSGLRDPLAVDPRALLAAARLEAGSVVGRWEPYHALAPEFVLARATSILDPPPTVTLAIADGALVATGSAPSEWITESRRLARMIPGIGEFRDDALVETELAALKEAIEARVVLFASGATTPAPDQLGVLKRQALAARRLEELGAAAGRRVQLEIVGHSDGDASADVNRRLSEQRAAFVAGHLGLTPRSPIAWRVIGVGADRPARPELSDDDKAANRRVTFRVSIGAGPPPAR